MEIESDIKIEIIEKTDDNVEVVLSNDGADKKSDIVATPDVNVIVEENLNGDKSEENPLITSTAAGDDDNDDVKDDDDANVELDVQADQEEPAPQKDADDVIEEPLEESPEVAVQEENQIENESETSEEIDAPEAEAEPKPEEVLEQPDFKADETADEPADVPQTNGHVEEEEAEETKEDFLEIAEPVTVGADTPETASVDVDNETVSVDKSETVSVDVDKSETVSVDVDKSETVSVDKETSETVKEEEEVGSVRVGDIKQRFMKEEPNNNSVKSSISKFGSPAKKEKAMFKVVQTEKCDACQKTVYAMEKLEMNSHIYHKNCFKCSHCSARLTPKTFSMNEGVIYCTNHFKQLFARKGNYDEGFGRQQYKKKWQDSKEVATA